MDIANILQQALMANHLMLAQAQQRQILSFLTLMSKWNRVFNLTSITNTRDMVYLHIIDSLLIAPYLFGNQILDVGSGAGLPGIPLAIMHPNMQWTLLDKSRKKTQFLRQICAELALTNVQIVNARCENFHPSERFDTIVARAFGSLALLKTATQHLLTTHGTYVAMKGKYPTAELAALHIKPDQIQVIPLSIQGMPIERHLVLFRD